MKNNYSDSKVIDNSNQIIYNKWKKIKNIYKILIKIKYSFNMCLNFIYDFTSYLQFYKNKIKIDKTEYFEISNEINNITNLILDLKYKINNESIEFFYEYNLVKRQQNIFKIYISLILLLNKYGSKNIINSISYYILFYTCIQDIYFLSSKLEGYDKHYNYNSYKTEQKGNSQSNTTTPLIKKRNKLLNSKELSSSLPNDLDNIIDKNDIDIFYQSEEELTELSNDEFDMCQDELFTMEINELDMDNPIRSISNYLIDDTLIDDNSINTNLDDKTKYNNSTTKNNKKNTNIKNIKKKSKTHTPNLSFRKSSLNNVKNYNKEIENKNNEEFNFDLINKLHKNKFNNLDIQNCIFYLNNIYKEWIDISVNNGLQYIELTSNLNKMILSKLKNIHKQYYQIISSSIIPYYFQVYLEDKNGTINNLSNLVSKLINKPYINYEINKIRNEIFIDMIKNCKIINKTNIVFFKATSSSLHISNLNNDKTLQYNSIHGLIKINFKNKNLILAFDGYITNQNISLVHQYTITSRKYNNIIQAIDNINNINPYFKNNIKQIIDLKQVLCYNILDITDYCFSLWKLYLEIIDLPIMDFINLFLNNDKMKKADILMSLLLNDYNEQARFKSHILWDIIIDESNYNNIQLEEEMFYLLHPSLQIKLRHIIDYQTKKEKELSSIDENSLGYERKIMLSNANDDVKQKAFEKLKEINNKSNDNISKPQQYLDGLLKIPFGNYMTEWIIKKSNDLNQNNKDFIINILLRLYKTTEEYKLSYQIFNDIINVFNLGNKIKILEESIKNIITNYNILDNSDGLSFNLNNNYLLNNSLPSIKVSNLKKIYSILNNYIQNADLIENNNCEYTYIENILNKCNKPVVAKILGIIKCKFKLNILSKDTRNKKEIIDILLQYFKNTNNYQINGNITEIENDFFEENIIIKNEILSQLHALKVFYDTGLPECVIQFKMDIMEYIENIKNIKKEKQTFLENCYSRLDESIYGQTDAKDQIIRIISQWINGNQSGYCLGFEGSPGLGKTSLAKYGISKALEDNDGKYRPFGFIALGGSSNGSMLEGHSYTYVGSTWGRIVEILMTSKCMNPIIFIDELDKISHTETGREIIGILTHLTDRTQNNEFCDKYFSGVKLDLSKVLFIFSYNDYSLLDSILADRIHRIKFNNYTVSDKLIISNKYLIPKLSEEINIMDRDVFLNDECLKYLITSYTYEAGVRKLKEKLYDIYRELNVRDINNKLENYIKSCITHLDEKNSKTNNPITLENEEFINVSTELIDDILSNHHKVDITKPFETNKIGVVYGLYATKSGIGGITIIQVCKKIIDTGNTLLCTGKQGEIMLESMKVALTLASNYVPKKYLIKYGLLSEDNDNLHLDAEIKKNKIKIGNDSNKTTGKTINKTLNQEDRNNIKQQDKDNKQNKYSFHIHCPDGATPKDGPSAGCAISLGLISLLTEIPIRNDISMTGEIDILGNALPIGGLDSKIMGSKSAGIFNVMIPRKNEKDLRLIKRNSPEILEDMNIIIVDTIEDVLKNGLQKEIEID